jgi:menaquinone-dependent protoporphyrinogen oxidase
LDRSSGGPATPDKGALRHWDGCRPKRTVPEEAVDLILVAYASRYGATQGIAERIAAKLRAAGQTVEVRPVKAAGDVASYDAFVVGSAVYNMHWLKEAAELVRRNRAALAHRPVWPFSSGPLGTEATDAKGRDVRTAAEPKEIAQFKEAINPRDHRVFFRALDGTKLGFAHRMIRKLPAARVALPEGDFREWETKEEVRNGPATGAAT